MHLEQLAAQDDTLADMDRQGRDVQAQLDTAKAALREVPTHMPQQPASNTANCLANHQDAADRASALPVCNLLCTVSSSSNKRVLYGHAMHVSACHYSSGLPAAFRGSHDTIPFLPYLTPSHCSSQ